MKPKNLLPMLAAVTALTLQGCSDQSLSNCSQKSTDKQKLPTTTLMKETLKKFKSVDMALHTDRLPEWADGGCFMPPVVQTTKKGVKYVLVQSPRFEGDHFDLSTNFYYPSSKINFRHFYDRNSDGKVSNDTPLGDMLGLDPGIKRQLEFQKALNALNKHSSEDCITKEAAYDKRREIISNLKKDKLSK